MNPQSKKGRWTVLTGLLLTAAVALSGCGGGGGGGTTPAATTTTTTTATTYSISGTVSGAVASGVTISVTSTAAATTTTDASGNYTVTGLYDGSYTVTPSKAGYTFNPISTAVTVSGANVTGTNFTATANSSATYMGQKVRNEKEMGPEIDIDRIETIKPLMV